LFSPRFHSEQRRHLLRAATAFPAGLLLVSCGGGGSGDGGFGPFPPAPSTPTGAKVTDRRIRVAPDVSLHVRDWQSDRLGGTTFVLLPGFGATAAHFNGLAPALAQRGRAIAISCRGFGRSDKPLPDATHPYDTDTLVHDVHEVLEALGIGRIVLAGHSIAGNQVTRFAGRYPERVRGLVYLDTNFDYTTATPDGSKEGESDNPALTEPSPTDADNASVAAAIAFNKRINQSWSAPMEADLLDKLQVNADGSVQNNTPAEVMAAMYKAARRFSPDYRPLRTPALALTTLPGDRQHMFPWLPARIDAATEKDASDMLQLFQAARTKDAAQLLAALPPGSLQKTFQPANHTDFFIAHEAEVLGLIDAMAWW